MSKIDKTLYNTILNSTQKELDGFDFNFNILNTGTNCILNLSPLSNIVTESNTPLSSEIVVGQAYMSGTGIVTFDGLPPFVSRRGEFIDVHFSDVEILLHMDIEGSSNSFTDSSSNNLSVTPSGNTTLVSTGLFNDSVFFDGGGSSLYIDDTGSVTSLGTDDFTIECFLFTDSNSINYSNYGTIIGGVGNSPVIRYDAGSNSMVVGLQGVAYDITPSPAVSLVESSWNHIAVVRDSISLRFYLNGSLVGENSSTGPTRNYSGGIIHLGAVSGIYPFSGFMDEFRVTRNLARYSGSSYTVPTQVFGGVCCESTHDFYIPSGISIDYETYGSSQSTTSWTITGTMQSDCYGGFDVILYDQNDEAPSGLSTINTGVCSGTYTNIGEICFIDNDITDSYRGMTLSLQNYDFNYFNLSTGFIQNSGCVDVYVNTTGVGIIDGPLYSEIVADDGINTYTGLIQVSVEYPQNTFFNQYNMVTSIPQGLSGSIDTPIVLGHKIPYNYIDLNDVFSCDIDANILTISTIGSSPLGAESLKYSNSGQFISVSIEGDLSNYFNGDTIDGTGTFSFTSSQASGSESSPFCGIADTSITDTVTFSSALGSFVTGVGPVISFSGGYDNVENSYFEPLGPNKVILAPLASGGALTSNDNSFFIYNYGLNFYDTVTHPTETGIREVVGVSSWANTEDYKVICTYKSTTSSFYVYSLSTQTWTSVTPFNPSSVISRIVRLSNNDEKYLILGEGGGEYSIYNSATNTTSGIIDNTDAGGMILPPKVALIADNQQAFCIWNNEESKDTVVHNDKYHIFALDHHYDGSSSYPLILDLQSSTIESGEFPLSGNITNNTTYLHGYLNNRTDVINVADKLAVSLSNTGNGLSELIVRDNTTQEIRTYDSDGDKRRVTKLINDQILWSCYSDTGISTVIDPYTMSEYPFPVSLTGSISLAASCNNEYRTLMLHSHGDRAYIFNDLDRTYQELSFTGSLPMGKYHDIFVFDQLSQDIDQSHNFYLMPTETYNSTFPLNNLIAISTTANSISGITVTGDFTVNETVISFAPVQTTTGLIPVGSFLLSDGEFNGSVEIGFQINSEEDDIFEASVDGKSGIIYIKSGIPLDYETKNSYAIGITGVDAYINRPPFFSSNFELDVLNIDEKPTGIILDPPYSGGYNHNIPVSENAFVASFEVKDPDTSGNVNIVDITGPDASIFTTVFDNSRQRGSLFIQSGTVFDINTKDTFSISLVVSQSGSSPSVTGNWELYLTDNPPISISLSPTNITLPENYSVPITGLQLATFTIRDDDTSRNNFVFLIGDDTSYFDLDYNFASSSGILKLAAGVAFDYETNPILTANLAAGNIIGQYSTTGTFTINITDVIEASGIAVSPSVVYLSEHTDTETGNIKLADLSWEDADFATNPYVQMVVYDLSYYGEGFRSATDKFEIIDNETRTPELYLKRYASLDFETQYKYDILIGGRPGFSTDPQYNRNGAFTLVLLNENEKPNVSFIPNTFTILETTETRAGKFKIAEVSCSDEELSSVEFSLSGNDSSYFTLELKDNIEDSNNSEIIGSLYFNSGVSLDKQIKDEYIATIIATDSSGLFDQSNFILNITDTGLCQLSMTADLSHNRCSGDAYGRILISSEYIGPDAASCVNIPPLIKWISLPDGATTGINGSLVNLLPNGSYSGFVYRENIPLTGISYTIESTAPDIEITNITKYQNPCSNSGYVSLSWSGGTPPFRCNYGNSSVFVTGSEYSATLPVYQNITSTPIIRDSLNCVASGESISFSFAGPSSFAVESQISPIIRNDTAESFQFNVSHGQGPYDINIYTVTDDLEADKIVYSFDKYDTSVLNKKYTTTNIGSDSSGNPVVILNEPDPQKYYYNLQNILYPDNYIFEFINISGCSFFSNVQTINNIPEIIAEIDVNHDRPIDNGFYNLSQPILDTLFIPYKMMVNNHKLLSYISSLDTKADLHLEIDGVIYERKILNGIINCDTYSNLNVSFLGIDNTEWFITLSFYGGIDITDTEIDILNKDIYLILPDKNKIKIVTDLNNNINTIKLLKGSILTTDQTISQYKLQQELKLYNFNTELGVFIQMEGSATVANTELLNNTYFPGNVFRITFLDNVNVSSLLRSDTIESVNFDCAANQMAILKNKIFLRSLNNFGSADNIYSKPNLFGHSGSINILLSGGYEQYTISYYYYDEINKCLSELLYNNNPLTTRDAEDLKSGIYLVKIRDIYGNKIDLVNGVSYDEIHLDQLDFILNELDTTMDAIQYEYGDLLLNIVNLDLIKPGANPPTQGPGFPDIPTTPVEPGPKTPIVTTSSHNVSPNTTLNNRVTIQTYPPKIPFTVTGPYGYVEKFYDRTILTQLPPGVYKIIGDEKVLESQYLYSQTRTINVSKNTNDLIDIEFYSYKNQTIIRNICKK